MSIAKITVVISIIIVYFMNTIIDIKNEANIL